MNQKADRFAVSRESIILKPIWEFLANPHPGSASENALNGGIRFVDKHRQTDMITVLMQAVESGHVIHAGDITMGKEQLLFHLPAFNGAAALVVGTITLELNGHQLNEKDILARGRIIEQPVPPDNNEKLPDKPVLVPYYMKPPIEELLKAGSPVPEIDQLVQGRIMTLRPYTLSAEYDVPENLREAVRKGIVSTTSIYAQNFVSIFSRTDRQHEAKELVRIVNGRTDVSPERGAQRIREILGLNA